MKQNAAFIYHPDEQRYRFNDDHPFNHKRLELTADLLRRSQALFDGQVQPPRFASEQELLRVHNLGYVEAVRGLSEASPSQEWLNAAEHFGLRTEDTPYFPGMHQATSLLVGGSLAAAENVMSGRMPHAIHLGGGLHHALQHKASGFCVYNDAAIAISAIREKYGARVLYVDTDVHHGDGVQWAFYGDPNVFTLSIHETGKYLFPGTGGADERGSELGFGTAVNLPLEPYTEDASWLEVFESALRRAAAAFQPDVIVSQHGCDAHAYDPLAHIHCSMEIYLRMPELLHRMAHEYCGGRWIALGGGGYDIWRVVPRAWSLLWLEMTDHPLLQEIKTNPGLRLPDQWVSRWQPESPVKLPETWLDPVHQWTPMPRRTEITEKNRKTLEISLQYLPSYPI